MIRKYQRFFNLMQVSLDATALFVAYVAVVLFKLHRGYLYDAEGLHVLRPLWMVFMLMSAYYSMGMYTPMRTRLFRKEALMVTRAHAAGFLAIFAVLFIDKSRIYSREMYLLFVSLSFVCVVAERYVVRRVLRYLRQKGYNLKHMLIVGAGGLGSEFALKVRANRKFGYNVIGFLDDELQPGTMVMGKPVLGPCTLLSRILAQHNIDEVVVALPLDAHDSYAHLVQQCEKAGVRIRIIPDYHHFLSCHTPHFEEFDGIPILSVRHAGSR